MRQRTQFKKEESNRSLNPSLETLLMRRYGASNINATFLDRVVVKGRRALGMAIDEEWTEALETWCHGYLQAQLADPAFLAAQQLRQLKAASDSIEKEVTSSSSNSKKGKKKREKKSKAAKLVEEKVKAVRKKTPRAPTVDDVLEARRAHSLRDLMVKEESTRSLLSMPKKPVRRASNPKPRASKEVPEQKQVRKKNLSPSEFLVRRNNNHMPLPVPEHVIVSPTPKSPRKKTFRKEPHPKAIIHEGTNESPKVGVTESFAERLSVTTRRDSSIMQSPAVRVPCVNPQQTSKSDDPLGKGSNHTQNSDSSRSLTMPQRKKSPIRGILKNQKKAEEGESVKKPCESFSSHTTPSSITTSSVQNGKQSPLRAIYGTRTSFSDILESDTSPVRRFFGTRKSVADILESDGEDPTYLTETMAAVNRILREEKKQKFIFSFGADPTSITSSPPSQPSFRTAEGDVVLPNASYDYTSSYSSVTFGSYLLPDKTNVDRWSAHSAKDIVPGSKARSSSAARPFRCRTIPLYWQERLDFTPKRPSRSSEASRSTA